MSLYDRPYSIVKEQISDMSARADTALARAYETMEQLKQIEDEFSVEPVPPAVDLPDVDMEPFPDLQAPNPNQFGTIGGIVVPELQIDLDAVLQDLDVGLDEPPAFSPSVIAVDLPARPGGLDLSGLPERPVTGEIELPSSPVLEMPSVGDLVQIEIPSFEFPELPTFDAEPSEFEGSAPATVLQWAEPDYSSDGLEQVRTRVAEMLKGGTGLPAAVEDALFGRARMREDVAAQKAVDDAFQDFASRGFDLPPGALTKRIDAVREANQLKISELSREIMAKSAEWEIENLRFAVQQGIALEAMLIEQFNRMAQRGFDAARTRLESDIALFNAAVALFNAKQSAYQVQAEVYRTKLQGELSRLEVYKARIEGERAKGELNEQLVRIYTGRLQALGTQIDVYKARMEGARVQASLVQSQIDAYRADVQAYAERLNAQKTEYDAYESAVRAEQAKIGILEAESRAFAATVQAYESKNNVKIQGVRAKVDVSAAKINQYTATLEAEKARVQAELSNIQAMTSAYQADVGRYTAQISAASSERDLQARTAEARLRNHLAYYEIQLKAYDAALTRQVQKVQLQAEAIKATGGMAAQLAAGAMAATNVSANLSGSSSLSENYSESHNYTHEV